jgi:hypothetical protein
MATPIRLSLKGPSAQIWLGDYSEEAASSLLAALTGFSEEHIAATYVNRVNKNDFSFKFSGGNGVYLEIIIHRKKTEA